MWRGVVAPAVGLVGPKDKENREEAADELVGPAGEQEHREIAESVGAVSNLQRS